MNSKSLDMPKICNRLKWRFCGIRNPRCFLWKFCSKIPILLITHKSDNPFRMILSDFIRPYQILWDSTKPDMLRSVATDVLARPARTPLRRRCRWQLVQLAPGGATDISSVSWVWKCLDHYFHWFSQTSVSRLLKSAKWDLKQHIQERWSSSKLPAVTFLFRADLPTPRAVASSRLADKKGMFKLGSMDEWGCRIAAKPVQEPQTVHDGTTVLKKSVWVCIFSDMVICGHLTRTFREEAASWVPAGECESCASAMQAILNEVAQVQQKMGAGTVRGTWASHFLHENSFRMLISHPYIYIYIICIYIYTYIYISHISQGPWPPPKKCGHCGSARTDLSWRWCTDEPTRSSAGWESQGSVFLLQHNTDTVFQVASTPVSVCVCVLLMLPSLMLGFKNIQHVNVWEFLVQRSQHRLSTDIMRREIHELNSVL